MKRKKRVKYSFITQKRKTYPVGLMCQLWLCSVHSRYSEKQYHEEILETVRGIAKSSDHSYGSRRIGKALNALDYSVGRWKVRSLMREAGVQVKHRRKYKVTTHNNHKPSIFENKLNRQFDVEAPNQVYVGNITYIWTQEG